MGYPLDVDAQDAALDALFSRDLSGIPTSWEVALFNDHPAFGGTELAATGGYARAMLNADLTDFPAAADGLKSSVLVDYGTSTGPWSDTARFALLISGDDSTTRWFVITLGQEISVDDAGVPVSIILRDYWNTAA